MALPTPDAFSEMIATDDLDHLVETFVLGGDVHLLELHPTALTRLGEHLSACLPSVATEFFIVGSAKLGFSLDPDKHPNPPRFSGTSDIDVVVVNADEFDRLWRWVREWGYWRRWRQPHHVRTLEEDVQYAVYSGWLQPDRIERDALQLPGKFKPMRDICVTWFNCFRDLGRYPEFQGRDVHARLYRTLDFARMYHRHGLQLIRMRAGRNQRGASTTA